MTLRTDLTDDTPEAGVHANQHNEVNQVVLGLQGGGGGGTSIPEGPTAPVDPVVGDLWVDTGTSEPDFGFSIPASSSPPTSPEVDELWIDTGNPAPLLVAPNGSLHQLTVANDGTLGTVLVS